MNKDIETNINYPKLVDDAMRDIVKKLLIKTAKNGVVGDHYFLVTFLTNANGVKLSDRLRKRYPSEMTIILQHQYESLEINELEISVRLSFDSIKETVVIPFDALTAFVDPSTRFALQFNPEFSRSFTKDNVAAPMLEDSTPKTPEMNNTNVIDLAQFRKKKDK